MRRTYWRLARGEKSCLVLSGLFPMMRTAMVRSAELGNGNWGAPVLIQDLPGA